MKRLKRFIFFCEIAQLSIISRLSYSKIIGAVGVQGRREREEAGAAPAPPPPAPPPPLPLLHVKLENINFFTFE